MLNQGPSIHFDPESRKRWAARLELDQRLKGHELQAAYERAGAYIAQRVSQLIKVEGWTLLPRHKEWYLFELTRDSGSATLSSSVSFQPSARSSHQRVTPRFHLPLLIADLLRPSRYESWSSILTDRRLVRCKRPNVWSQDLYIESPGPIADILYLLQVLVPGVIQIRRIDWIEGVGDQHIARALPRESWIQKNATELEHILGDRARVQRIMESAGESTSLEVTWDRSEYQDFFEL